MSHYAGISRQIRDVFARYTPLVEPLSLDEAFLDVSGCVKLFGSPEQIARQIKQEILRETGLIASVGVAPNKFLAKIASDLEKPDALVVVDPERVAEFLEPLPVERIWGVGKVTAGVMHRLGVHTIGQLRSTSVEQLRRHFGDHGEHFWRLACGIDHRHVVPDRQAKSLSHETTFATDIAEPESLRYRLWELTEQVARRLRRTGRYGRTVQVKLRFSDFRTITRSKTLSQPSDITADFWRATHELLETALPTGKITPGIRLIGMGISGLADPQPVQQLLFEDPSAAPHEQQRQLDRVTDTIHTRFGVAAITRATNLAASVSDTEN